jgi:hypothetical protein
MHIWILIKVKKDSLNKYVWWIQVTCRDYNFLEYNGKRESHTSSHKQFSPFIYESIEVRNITEKSSCTASRNFIIDVSMHYMPHATLKIQSFSIVIFCFVYNQLNADSNSADTWSLDRWAHSIQVLISRCRSKTLF